MGNRKRTNLEVGLTLKEVEENRKKFGDNQITGEKQNRLWQMLLETLGDPIIKILLIALMIKTIFLFQDFDWFETLGIVIAIFVASFISTISEYGSEKAFRKLQEASSKISCKVKRNGKVENIPIDDIVVGDLVLLQAGDKIPADGIIVQGEASVDESSINGEAKEKNKEPNLGGNITPKNSVYRGCVVYAKEAWMQVLEVGNQTFYGKMAQELQEKQPESPLKVRLRGLAKMISRVGYCGAFLVSFSYLFSVIVIDNGFDWTLILETLTNFPVLFGHILYALTLSVTIIVVAVPEGLPMMITLVLSSNMKRLLKNHVLVRKLVGIETAGSLNLLFTDKTGTLTKGKLEVTCYQSATFHSYHRYSDLKPYHTYAILMGLSLFANNASSFDSKRHVIGGNMTDRALLSFLKEDPKIPFHLLKSESFDSKKKYSTALVDWNSRKMLLVKGAPEKILPLCTSYVDEGMNKHRTFDKQQYFSSIAKQVQDGVRVLALAYSDQYHVENLANLTFLGFLMIQDEVRKEAIEGVRMVEAAGIQTVMITGDNKDTAMSIARQVGLLRRKEDIVLTSDEMALKSDEELREILPRLRIVARSLPQDKSRLVRIGQSLGLVVGMTGDGVNDAPALKKADVGFAMGSGTEVSKEASDIVILDDNFLSISKAILFGRTIFKSIRKFIIFQLTINLCAILLSVVGPFIGVETPVTVIQMLWINMIMDTLAGIAFSYEPPLKEYMKEPPKKKEEPIMNRYMIGEILFTGLYSSLLCVFFLKSQWVSTLFRFGENDKYLMTAFFGLFIFMGIFNCFNARTHRLNLLSHFYENRAFLFVILFIIVVQVYLIYYGGEIFRTFGLTFIEFQIMLLFAFTVVPVDFIRKIYLRCRGEKGGV